MQNHFDCFGKIKWFPKVVNSWKNVFEVDNLCMVSISTFYWNIKTLQIIRKNKSNKSNKFVQINASTFTALRSLFDTFCVLVQCMILFALLLILRFSIANRVVNNRYLLTLLTAIDVRSVSKHKCDGFKNNHRIYCCSIFAQTF